MNCDEFQSIVGDLARDQMMEATARTQALAHIDECERCGQTWSDQQGLSEGLRSVADQMNSLQAPAHLEERLRAAFRDRSRAPSLARAPQRWLYWASAVAAVLLLVFGLVVWLSLTAAQRRQPTQFSSNGTTVPQPDSPRPEKSLPVASTGSKSANVVAPKAPSHRHLTTPHLGKQSVAKLSTGEQVAGLAANTETREVATDFVPLGYGSASDLQEGGQMVRVELPRSALARFGLPMNMNRADERVKADVLVGADGLARAIRFVK